MGTIITMQPRSAPVYANINRAWRNFKFPLPNLTLLCAVALLFAAPTPLSAHTPTAQASTPTYASPQKPIHPHKRPNPVHALVPPAAETLAPMAPPAPEPPKWPAFDQPAQAAVIWDSHGLSIDAANSSLLQILKDVSSATGAKVDGLGSDERIFGVYGPGQARDVLSQLLQGSGYNIMMIGDQGQGAPRQILLSARQAGVAQSSGAKSSPNSNEDDEPDEQPAAQEPPPMRPGFPPPGMAPRSPQQVQQEMQQRQQQMQQNQQPGQQPTQTPVNPQY
jgi:outer membrane biosynthesis protein TonB